MAKKRFNTFINLIKRKIEQEGKKAIIIKIAIYLIVIFSVGNLAFSQIHIGVVVHVFNRIIGLWMFSFILFGLVGLFSVTRLNGLRNSTVRAMISILIASIFGAYYAYLLMMDVKNEVSVNFDTISSSFISSIVVIVAYMLAFFLLLIGEFFYED